MDCVIREESAKCLPEYAQIPIAFEVQSILDVHVCDHGLSGIVFSERILPIPFVKDYDAVEACIPTSWPQRWNLSNWGIFSAFVESERAGGCAIAYDTEGLLTLAGQRCMAVLWDLRVHPHFRGKGIGANLFETAAGWAISRGCQHMHIETQNINVPACRFYARHGCVLASINRFAYPAFPDEVELVWRKDLQT